MNLDSDPPELEHADMMAVRRDGRWFVCHRDQSGRRRPSVLLPGSFNPFHLGHDRMARFAERRLGRPVDLELSLENVDKPRLSLDEAARRTATIPTPYVVWLTLAPTFVEKLRLFQDVLFLIGADTAERIGDPRYYGDDPHRRDAALAELARRACRLMVYGRSDGHEFKTLGEMDLATTLRELCVGIGEDEFRCDVSSTAIRRQGC